MKAKLKKVLGLAALGMTLFSNTTPVWAGMIETPRVVIKTLYGRLTASGSMVGARYSADSTQVIGCTAYVMPTYTWTSCFARDSAGQNLVCGDSGSYWTGKVQQMTASSLITFTLQDVNGGGCNSIQVENKSSFLK